jgi:hypothetical protein
MAFQLGVLPHYKTEDQFCPPLTVLPPWTAPKYCLLCTAPNTPKALTLWPSS